MNYYEHHLGDYAKDTLHLSMLEHGAYRLLLDRYYATEKGIPADQAHRLARARTRDEREAVDAVLAEFFVLTDGVWCNRRADEEVGKAQAKITAAQANGKKGGRPKKNRTETQEKPSGFLVGSENETQTKAHQTPDTSNTPTTTARAPAIDNEVIRMAADWTPGPSFTPQAKLMGIPVHNAEDMADGLNEFRAYWLARPDTLRTQAEWDNALAKSLKHRQVSAASRPQPTAAPRRTGSHAGFQSKDYTAGVNPDGTLV